MRQNIVTIQVQDQPGELGRIAQLLADADVNIVAYNTFAGNAMIVPDNVDKCVSTLNKANINCSKSEVLTLDLPNTKGQLAKIGTELGKAGVNIDGSFGAAAPNKTGAVYLAVDDIKKAEPVVEKFATTQTIAGNQ